MTHRTTTTNILYEFQSGFRGTYSTDTCLLYLQYHIRNQISNGLYTGMVLLDIQKAFDSVNQSILEHNVDDLDILMYEVEQAIKRLRNGKSPGIDNIQAELLKESETEGIKIIHRLCNKIWRSKEWPEDWKRAVFLPLPKKGDTRECANNRTISLISHASKVLLHIIAERIREHLENELPPEQAGFRKGRGTRNQIGNLRNLVEKNMEFQQPLFLCFIDYSKAFDCVQHGKLWNIMTEMGFSSHVVNLIRSLYSAQEATVRTESGDSEWFTIGQGVRQGCILSPYLFNVYAEYIMRNALDGFSGEVSVGGRQLTNLRYADDTTLIARTAPELQNLIDRVKSTSEEYGLFLNVKKKTKQNKGHDIWWQPKPTSEGRWRGHRGGQYIQLSWISHCG